MTMRRAIVAAEFNELGEDEVEVVMSTGDIARDGHILVPQGAELANYRRNPIFLWQHKSDVPVARAEEITIDPERLIARVRFAPAGVSADADRVRGLVKSRIVNCVSVGFDVIEAEPLDPAKPRGGQRFLKWELLECSFVSVPADTGAVVTAREHETINDARARLGLTPIERSDIVTESTPAAAAAAKPGVQLRAHPRGVAVMVRSLYDIGRLAYLLDCLCDAHWSAQFESALEGDASAVPAMLAKAMQDLGAALITMTAEEVAEALAGTVDDDDEGEGLDAEATTIILASASPELKRFRIGLHRARAVTIRRDDSGMSPAEMRSRCREASAHLDAAMEHSRAGMRAKRRAADCVRAMFSDDEVDTQQVQTSDGTDDDTENDRATEVEHYRRIGELHARRLGAAAD